VLVSVGSRFVSSDPGKGGALVRVPLHDALLATYTSDAHVYYYYDPANDSTPRHSDKHPNPRFDALVIDTLFCDLDNPDHAPWPDDATAIAAALRARDLAQTAGVYVTQRGLRLVQPLERALPVLEADAALRAWYVALAGRGLAIDHATSQWTRCMRLPHVTRDHKPYRSPLVDLSRMRPIDPPSGGFVRRSRGRSGPLVEVAERTDIPPLWAGLADELQVVVAGEPWGVADGWHVLALRLSGAALQLGLRPEHAAAFILRAFPDPMPRHDAARAAHDTARRYASRKDIQGRRVLEDAHPRVAEVLLGRLRPAPRSEAARRLPPAADAAQALLEDLRDVRPGLRLIAAACGVGKTRAAQTVAAERAAAGLKTIISVPAHELAHQIVGNLRAAGVDARRVHGPLSVRNPDGSYACHYHVAATRLAEGRQPVQKTMCEAPCEHRDGCIAREGTDGPKDALVVVGPHALLRGLAAEAGATSLLVLDEPPPVTEQVVLRSERLREVESYEERFEPAYIEAVLPAVRLVRWWLELGPMGSTHHLSEAFDLDLGEAARQAREALEGALVGHEPPKLRTGAAYRCKYDPTLALTLGRISKTLDTVRRCLLGRETRARIEPAQGDPTKRQLALTLLREDLAIALRREGPTVVAAADVELHRHAYARVAAVEPALSRYAAADGAPVDRVHLRMRATRTHWLPAPTKMEGAAYQALELALLWLRERVWSRAGLVTYQALERRLKGEWASLLPPGLEVRHYGELRGLDGWKDFDALVTLGDPFGPPDHVERELLLLDLPSGEEAVRERSAALAAAELEQAHGRLRAPHRTAPARALHVGGVVPAGWSGHRTVEGLASAITPAEVARLVAIHGGPRVVGRLLGKSHGAVSHWCSGLRRCPPDVAEWLRSRSAPTPGLDSVDGSVTTSGYVPLVNNIDEGVVTKGNEGVVTTGDDDHDEDPEAAA
jgi:hypothetical protein